MAPGGRPRRWKDKQNIRMKMSPYILPLPVFITGVDTLPVFTLIGRLTNVCKKDWEISHEWLYKSAPVHTGCEGI